jgi:glutamine synthetase
MTQMMNGSELCTGAALDGVPQEVNDEEISPRPDPNSVMILPWRPDVAWFAHHLCCEGKPFVACNRTIFRNVLDEAASMGFRFNFGIEPEFFYLLLLRLVGLLGFSNRLARCARTKWDIRY